MSEQPTDGTEQEKVRGTEVVVILERDEDGAPSETIERRVPRNILSKAEYRRKAKQNSTWKWNGTLRIDLSDEGLTGDRSGMIDVKYVEGGIFVSPNDDGNGCSTDAEQEDA